MASLNLAVCNRVNKPTFVRGNSESHIDLTFASNSIVKSITNWRILEKESLSLHQYITFDIAVNSGEKHHRKSGPRWSRRKQDDNKLKAFIERNKFRAANHARSGAEELVKYLEETCNNSMPKGFYQGKKKPLHWWTTEIADLRKKCLGARRKLKRATKRSNNIQNSIELQNYRNAQKELKREIQRSKNKSWDLLCKQVDTDPWGLPYKIVTKKLIGRKPIPGISIPWRIEAIVNELFPSKNEITWHRTQEKITFPEFTHLEILECAKKIPLGKAPGPDGIPDGIIKKLAFESPMVFGNVYNSCLKEAYFPEEWKVAKLVLLRKGSKPLDQHKSYRLICLLNTAGKFFERLIKCRLEQYLATSEGLSERQYGFRKGRSTIDAISKAMELVVSASSGPLRRREMCTLVALDVANAFNSANWDIIVKALRNKGVPEYLRNVIQDYLNNIYLIYGEGKKLKVTCGVPQGSILGPTLWNIMYDDLLNMDLNTQRLGLTGHSSAELVAFADDVAIIVTGRTTDILEDRANEALEKVSTWMKANDLKLAVDKTECVMLTKKRGYKEPIFTLNGNIVQPKESLRYLEIELSKKLGYGTHIQAAAVKAGKTANALQRILPNVRGARQCKRRIMASTVQNQLLYGAQIWAGALGYEINVSKLLGSQRQIALRVAMAYRTVSTQAIMVFTGMIPVHLLAKERQKLYKHTKEGKEVNKQDHRANTYKE